MGEIQVKYKGEIYGQNIWMKYMDEIYGLKWIKYLQMCEIWAK